MEIRLSKNLQHKAARVQNMLKLLSKRGKALLMEVSYLKEGTSKKIRQKEIYKLSHRMLEQPVVPETDMLTISFILSY
jgi:hypothetical protein